MDTTDNETVDWSVLSMKKFLAGILAAISLISMKIPAYAAEVNTPEAAPAYTILVGEQPLDLRDLPYAPYKEGSTVMVPLRKIAEALGFRLAGIPIPVQLRWKIRMCKKQPFLM